MPADKFDARTLVNNLAARQTAYYRSLANSPIFGTGWLRRSNARRDAALAMLQSETTLAA
jgi:lysozyme family protein